MTDTLLNLSYALVVIALLALVWGSVRNLIKIEVNQLWHLRKHLK